VSSFPNVGFQFARQAELTPCLVAPGTWTDPGKTSELIFAEPVQRVARKRSNNIPLALFRCGHYTRSRKWWVLALQDLAAARAPSQVLTTSPSIREILSLSSNSSGYKSEIPLMNDVRVASAQQVMWTRHPKVRGCPRPYCGDDSGPCKIPITASLRWAPRCRAAIENTKNCSTNAAVRLEISLLAGYFSG
jgi:hypothetical protein